MQSQKAVSAYSTNKQILLIGFVDQNMVSIWHYTEPYFPSKPKTLTQCCFDVVPTSQTVGQHQNNIGWMSCVATVLKQLLILYHIVCNLKTSDTELYIFTASVLVYPHHVCKKLNSLESKLFDSYLAWRTLTGRLTCTLDLHGLIEYIGCMHFIEGFFYLTDTSTK